MTNRSVYLALTVCFMSGVTADAAVRYAKPTATGTGDCTSWTNACTLGNTQTPGTALALAAAGDQIWAMSGTYLGIYSLKSGVKIIGGFAGTEVTASQSNPTTNHSVINGRVFGSDNDASTVLRGFTVRIGDGGGDGEGGGMNLKHSSALIVQCIFEDNTTIHFGGAVSIRNGGSPQFINCIFRRNGLAAVNPMETKVGGAVFLDDGTPKFVNCLFDNNKAWEGGVIQVLDGTPTFINCTIVNNQATIGYGGVFYDPAGQATFRNCIFRSNTTTKGLGRYDQGYSGSTGMTDIRFSNVQGGWETGTSSIDANPLFQNFAGGNYELQSASPSKNTGENAAITSTPDVGDLDWDGNTTEGIPMDLARVARVLLGTVDMGAFEFGCHTAGTDCDLNGAPDTCEIQYDPTLDCHNQNGVLDLCEAVAEVPKGACCVEFTCDWPTTSCACAASGGVWHANKKCFQVTCCPNCE